MDFFHYDHHLAFPTPSALRCLPLISLTTRNGRPTGIRRIVAHKASIPALTLLWLGDYVTPFLTSRPSFTDHCGEVTVRLFERVKIDGDGAVVGTDGCSESAEAVGHGGYDAGMHLYLGPEGDICYVEGGIGGMDSDIDVVKTEDGRYDDKKAKSESCHNDALFYQWQL